MLVDILEELRNEYYLGRWLHYFVLSRGVLSLVGTESIVFLKV